MRIRTSLAALVFLASNAAASASLLPAVEVRARYIGAATGYATRTITRTGALFVLYYPIVPGWPGDYALPPSFFPPESGNDAYQFNADPYFLSYGGLSESGRVIEIWAEQHPGGSARLESYVSTAFGGPNPYVKLAVPPGYPTGLSLPPNTEIRGTAINSGNLIVGRAQSRIAGAGLVPVWWSTPTAVAQELPRIAGLDSGPFPVAVNDNGVIVGSGGATTLRAAIWKPAAGGGYTLAFLGELSGGASSQAWGIGFMGKAVGSSNGASASQEAVVWTPTPGGYIVTPLPVPPGGSCSAATAINVYEDIVGNCTLAGGEERGVLWRYLGAGSWTLAHQLEPLSGGARSVAYALNNDGQAGGASGPFESQVPVLWSQPASAPVSVPALSRPAWLLLGSILAGTALARLRRREQSPSRVRGIPRARG